MGVDTKILLTSPPPVLDLLKYASRHYSNARLYASHDGTFFTLAFKDGDDERQLSLFPPEMCANDYADVHSGDAIYLSMGCWGNSEAIARRMALHFGGLIMPNDSTDDWVNPAHPREGSDT